MKKIDKSKYSKTKKGNRVPDTKPLRVYFLIVCEGEKTEPNYFEGIQKHLSPHMLSIVNMNIQGDGKNTLSLVKSAIEMRDKSEIPYDRVWVVFDKDSFPDGNFDNAIHKAEAKNICCAWSNEAFELWYTLHFQNVIHGMPRKDYRKFIEKEFKQKGITNFVYKKNDPNMFDLLEKHGDRNQATKRAEALINQHCSLTSCAKMNPCTHVFKLVDEIFNADKILDGQ